MAQAIQEGLAKRFKLTTTFSTSNMHLFNENGVIQKYESPEHSILQQALKAISFAALSLDLSNVDQSATARTRLICDEP